MEYRERIKCVMELLQGYLNLDEKHCYIYNQKWLLPEDDSLHVVLSQEGIETIGNTLKYKSTETALISTNSLTMIETIGVDIFSFSSEARLRQPEVLASFNSDFAIRSQEYYGYQFGYIPTSFTDVSSAEASKILNRYRTTLSVIYGKSFSRNSPYFNGLGGLKTIIND